MCGIAGAVLREGERPASAVLGRMAVALAHRGPDDSQVRAWGRAGFAFRRLSIIDVSGGAQPLTGEDGSIHAMLNGEIYNHLSLREELEAHGHRFSTRSDAEALVHGYEEWGDAVVERLHGMFALAVWDEKRQRLLLARDRLGKKPLVYWEAEGRIVFASELQSLICAPGVPRRPDFEAIHHYLTFQYVPAPASAFQGIRKLPPAHRLVFDAGRCRTDRYWTLSFGPKHKVDGREAAREVRRRLRESVRMRLMSDVPLGAFLSGGLDSSSVVALMAEFGRVRTFSIGFEEGNFDELRWARLVADRYGTDHHEFVVRPKAAELIPRLVRHFGEPFADSSALPTFEVSRLAAGRVKVALNGDGGDELFAGYPRYRFVHRLGWVGAFGRPGKLARRFVPETLGLGSGLPPLVARTLHAFGRAPTEIYARSISYFTPEQKREIYSPLMREVTRGSDSYELLFSRAASTADATVLDRLIAADTMGYLPDDLLVKVDIASMAHGLECRSPFLDHELVEYVARLPDALKLSLWEGKRVLRSAVSDLVPGPILRRKKMGFGVPMGQWFRGELRSLLRDTVLGARALQRPYFEPTALERLIQEHEVGARDHSYRLWALLMLELWHQEFIDAEATTPTTTTLEMIEAS